MRKKCIRRSAAGCCHKSQVLWLSAVAEHCTRPRPVSRYSCTALRLSMYSPRTSGGCGSPVSSVHAACCWTLSMYSTYVCCCRILLALLVLRMIWYFQAAAVSYQVRARCNIMYCCTRIALPDTRYHAGWCLYIYQVYVKDTGPTGKTRSIPQQIHVHASHYCCCRVVRKGCGIPVSVIPVYAVLDSRWTTIYYIMYVLLLLNTAVVS